MATLMIPARMARGRRALAHLAPSAVASLVGSLVAGLIGSAGAGGPVRAVAAAGYLLPFAVPALLCGSLAARALLRAWRPAEIADRVTEEGGGAPRLAAWIAYLLLAGWLLTAFTFNFVLQAVYRSPAKRVQALASALAVVVAVAVLCALSWPAIRLLTGALRALDRRMRRGGRRSILRPAWILTTAGAALAALCWIGWELSVSPRIGPLDLSPLYYVAAGVVAAIAIHLLWKRLARTGRTRIVSAGIALLAALSFATALWVRYRRPYTMLEIWGETALAGPAIDELFHVQSLRRELRLEGFTPVARPGASHPDVVLVTIDTFRADRAPVYGGPAKMPALAKFSQDAVVFARAISPGNVTRRSLPTIATGVSPHRVRGRVAGWALQLDPRHVMLAERFRAAGYATAGFFCCRSHFAPEHELGLSRGIDHLVINKDSAVLVEKATKWLASGTKRPLFIWFHFIEPHGWQHEYPRGKKYGRSYAERYDHSLAAIDRDLQVIFDHFLTEKRRDHTVLLITSDHGEGLGDHGAKHHATDLYDSQIHVPLLVSAPGLKSRRIHETVGLVDVAPTLLDLAGYEPPGMPQMDGESLAPLLRGERAARRPGEAYSVMVKDRSVAHDAWALVLGNYKLIEPGGGKAARLYNVAKDPHERRNLAERKPEVLRRLRRRLKARKATDRVSPF